VDREERLKERREKRVEGGGVRLSFGNARRIGTRMKR
jgi:hypothetical protein